MRTPFTLRLFQSMPRGGWIALAIFAAVAWIGVPVAHLALPESHPLHVSAYTVSLLGKILCYMVVAVAMDLIWGYAGILSLGHGLFFALGGYAFGMYLMRQIGRDGSYGAELPDFMVFLDWKELPCTGRARTLCCGRCSWWSRCPGWWPSCSAGSPSARASRACTSRSSPRR